MNVIAHRGDSGNFPENSLPAFRSAVAAADCLEFDVRLSSDNQLVVLHDESLERTHGIPKNVGTIPSDKLTTLDPPVPLLTEVLELKHPSIVELKTPGIETLVVDALDDFGAELGCGYISVRSEESVALLQDVSQYPVGLMQKRRSADEMNRLVEEMGIQIAQIRWKTYSEDQICHLRGLATVNAFCADEPEGWARLISWGVHGILTNFPKNLRKYLHTNSSSGSP